MFILKKSKKKTTNSKENSVIRKIYYALFFLLSANIIVLAFFSYFIFKLYSNNTIYSAQNEINIPSIPKLENAQDVEVSAASFIVYDPLTRTTVLSKNSHLRLSPASSIKILTALVALDHYDSSQYLTINTTASVDESKMGLYVGEEISVDNLLYGLLLISGNDAAKNLALNYRGGQEAFIQAMNAKARELELTQSHFLDPSGYLDNNYSTAYDMARLASYAMTNPKIREIVGTSAKVVYDRYGLSTHPLKNLNELLVNKNVTGVKTGFTNEAGGVLITSYIHHNRELIIVVMKSQDRFADTQKIIDAIDKKVIYSEVGSID